MPPRGCSTSNTETQPAQTGRASQTVFPFSQETKRMTRRLLVGVLLIGLHAFVGVTLIPDLAPGPFGSVLAWAYLALSAVLMRYGVLVRGKGNAVLAWSGLLAMGIFFCLSIFSLLRSEERRVGEE